MKRFGDQTRVLVLPVLALAIISEMAPAMEVNPTLVDSMFQHIRAETTWNIDGEMLWGYFFTAPDAAKLESVAQTLKARGYRVVEIYHSKGKYWLHVEKVETHSPNTLKTRNAELNALATRFQNVDYDGMDVGPVQASK